LPFSASGESADTFVYPALAFNILLSYSLSVELADTFVREIFGIPANTLSDLTFVCPLSIAGQIDWHAWLTFPELGEHLTLNSSMLIFASTVRD